MRSKTTRRWKSTDDIIRDCERVMNNLDAPKFDIQLEKARVQAISTATRVVNSAIRHAEATGRLRKGSSKLPKTEL